MRNQTYEKKSLDDIKEEIIEILASDIMEDDKTLSVNALQHYRKQMGVNIEDSMLATQYSNYIVLQDCEHENPQPPVQLRPHDHK